MLNESLSARYWVYDDLLRDQFKGKRILKHWKMPTIGTPILQQKHYQSCFHGAFQKVLIFIMRQVSINKLVTRDLSFWCEKVFEGVENHMFSLPSKCNSCVLFLFASAPKVPKIVISLRF